MPSKKISQLTPAVSGLETDEFPIAQAGITKKIRLSQLVDFIIVPELKYLTSELSILGTTADISSHAQSLWDFNYVVPVGSVILSVQISLDNDILSSLATKIGVGIDSDPDKYGKTTGLTQNLKIDTIPSWVILSQEENIKLFAVDDDGNAIGTIGGGVNNRIQVRIIYLNLTSLPSV